MKQNSGKLANMAMALQMVGYIAFQRCSCLIKDKDEAHLREKERGGAKINGPGRQKFQNRDNCQFHQFGLKVTMYSSSS